MLDRCTSCSRTRGHGTSSRCSAFPGSSQAISRRPQLRLVGGGAATRTRSAAAAGAGNMAGWGAAKGRGSTERQPASHGLEFTVTEGGRQDTLRLFDCRLLRARMMDGAASIGGSTGVLQLRALNNGWYTTQAKQPTHSISAWTLVRGTGTALGAPYIRCTKSLISLSRSAGFACLRARTPIPTPVVGHAGDIPPVQGAVPRQQRGRPAPAHPRA